MAPGARFRKAGDLAMERILQGFERAAGASPAIRFIDVMLRGAGQVMFMDNPLTGLFFVAAIVWGAFAVDAPLVALAGLLALAVATGTALVGGFDRASWRAGLYGYNALLTGLALGTFLAPGAMLFVFVVIAGAFSVVVSEAVGRFLKVHAVPGLTFGFVLTAWLFLLASHGFAGLPAGGLPTAVLPGGAAVIASDPLAPGAFLAGVALSISQVFLKDSIIAALLFLSGLAVASLPAALLALAGAVIAVAVAHLSGAESDLVTGGLLGFSPVLTAVALGTVFGKPTPRGLAYAAFGTVVTVIAQAALNAGLAPFGLPALTMPFVLVTWLFLLARPAPAA